ncbi:phage major capsid protein [Acidaminococcus sp. DS4831]|uniref:phage major capsid protein n=1 Tax=Acidaminococcus sp. DS4831 TaxID=3141399 RepID=UPI0032E50B60
MKKSDELRQIVASLKKEVMELQAKEQMDEAAAKAKELNDAVRDLHTQEAVEAADLTKAMQHPSAPEGSPIKSENIARLRNRVFNKMVFGRALDAQEREFADAAGTPGLVETTPGKGGYIVPEEQISILREYRRANLALRSFCGYQTVTSDTGKRPTLSSEKGKLVAFDELNEINQDDLDFGQITYKISSYGDIIPVSNELAADNNINLMEVIGRRFATKSINTENDKILAKLPTKGSAITDYKGILNALNTKIDPMQAIAAIILTNQSGFDYLDELTDTQGRPLLTPSLADPSMMTLRGKIIVPVSDSILATPTAGIPFYVGAMAEAVAFFDRQQVAIEASSDAGFTKNATYIRAIERFDVEADDAGAMVLLNYKVGA